jgi:pyridoxamine 5'-phosphate oxidase
MVLASATPGGDPSCRVVLCKALEPDAGALVFFTNYDSRKGGELDANPRCSAVFHWDHAARQARVGGAAARVSAEESDEYFRSRPLLSRLGAWASDQSRPLAARTELLTRTREVMRRFGVTPLHLVSPAGAPEIPRPPHWGGYRILLDSVELWLGGSGRLHDRARWTRTLAGSPSPWAATRLQP